MIDKATRNDVFAIAGILFVIGIFALLFLAGLLAVVLVVLNAFGVL